MHKLKGSAGMLAAKSIHQLASQAEAACAAGQAEHAALLATRLTAELQRLRLCAAPALVVAPVPASECAADSGAEDLKPPALAEFVDLLSQQSMAATERFKALSPQLQRLLSKDSYELVRDHIDNLQFTDAARVLEASPSVALLMPRATAN
jgi:HPt (histidine-containing phosphotransfer) domain-containing protein